MQKTSIVYSQPNCQACNAVKAILAMHGYEVEERKIDGIKWTKADLFQTAPNARSVPQVVIDGVLIGGLSDVSKFVQTQ
jgi:glutaredoxin